MSEISFAATVDGGHVVGSLWNAAASGTPVLGLHGITANHRSFVGLARSLDRPVLAIDQRGRGASRNLPGPYALTQLADDAARALDTAEFDKVVVVGHSMGGFVATRLAERHPDRVESLVLVDGGLPLRPPPVGVEVTAEEALGPAVARLQMTFDSAQGYRDFWHEHPAVGPYWSDLLEEYIDYDLVDVDGALRPSTRPEAMETNFLELGGQNGYSAAVHALEESALPRVLLTAPRGLFDEVPPLYDAAWIDEWRARLPGLMIREVDDVNHYTILIGDGVRAIVDVIDTLDTSGGIA